MKHIAKSRSLMTTLFFAIILMMVAFSFSALAAETDGDALDVTVTFQMDNSGFYLAKQAYTLAPNLSESYGYVDSYEGAEVTSLDALVAMHITIFGDENLGDYLTVSSGLVSRIAGIDTYNFMYFVNGTMLFDENGLGYNVDSALLTAGDDVMFIIMQDGESWCDILCWFEDEEGNQIKELTVTTDEEFSLPLVLMGYITLFAYYGDPEEYTEPLEDAAIVAVEIDETGGFRVGYFGEPLAITDADGKATISFDQPGTYYISAYDTAGYFPLISPWLTVIVKEPVDKEALNGLIAEAETLEEEAYTAATWDALQTALTAAKAVADNEDAIQTEVDAAKDALAGAIEGLIEKTPPTPWVNPFNDVKTGDWFYSAVEYMNERAYIAGMTDSTFGPNLDITRGMVVTILHRTVDDSEESEGSLLAAAKSEPSFTDVPQGKWYSEGVEWASENGLVVGYGNGLFGVDDEVTREQFVLILYNYAKLLNMDVSATDNLSDFKDANQTASWARKAMEWAVGAELVSGRSADRLAPAGTATRAEIAALIMRFLENN